MCIDAQRKKYTMKYASKISKGANVSIYDLCNCLFEVIFQNLLYAKTAVVINMGEDDKLLSTPISNTDKTLDIISLRGEPLDKYEF